VTPAFLADALLAGGLVVVALRVATGRSLFRDIVLFIVFGLIVALSWARLGAPDLAMAEAALGAGVTGALVLMAYRRLTHGAPPAEVRDGPRRRRVAAAVAALAAVAFAVIALAALGLDDVVGSAGAAALTALPDTGLGNPVTGVLLVFRGLDTLLELFVLLVALIGAWAVMRPSEGPLHHVSRATPLVAALLSIVAPLCVLVAVHLLVVGAHEPGGAFQAGAILAALGVLLVLTGVVEPVSRAGPAMRLVVLLGPLTFTIIGVSALAFGRPVLMLPGAWAIYLVEAAMMLSIGVTLTLLFSRSLSLRRGRG
jgi:multisubunit Na+/H+ antiporter MnhB subunit